MNRLGSFLSVLQVGICLCGLVCLGASSPVRAASLSFFTQSLLSSTELQGALQLPRFQKHALLQRVDVIVGAEVVSGGTIRNRSAQPATFTLHTDSLVTLHGPNGLVLAPDPSTLTPVSSLAVGDTYTFGPIIGNDSKTTTYTSAGSLSAFLGKGDLLLPYQSLTSIAVLGGGGNLVLDQNTQAKVSTEVTYTFQRFSVPEFSTSFLLGLLLLGGVAGRQVRSRRRRRSIIGVNRRR